VVAVDGISFLDFENSSPVARCFSSVTNSLRSLWGKKGSTERETSGWKEVGKITIQEMEYK
jgi:hypothetical protein